MNLALTDPFIPLLTHNRFPIRPQASQRPYIALVIYPAPLAIPLLLGSVFRPECERFEAFARRFNTVKPNERSEIDTRR